MKKLMSKTGWTQDDWEEFIVDSIGVAAILFSAILYIIPILIY